VSADRRRELGLDGSIMVADLKDQSIRLWAYEPSVSDYEERSESAILMTSAAEIQKSIAWP
jgi:hypothetical protein